MLYQPFVCKIDLWDFRLRGNEKTNALYSALLQDFTATIPQKGLFYFVSIPLILDSSLRGAQKYYFSFDFQNFK
ncbi:MAG: hypothetical protein CL529_04450 [Aequorivita sp.]|nr:hypothetical protein [Aequorivita sp.]